LSIGQRELIAAYTSGVNACQYCHGSHTRAAEYFGIETGLIDQLLTDLNAANVDESFKPILKYVHKLTRDPSRMTQADADAVFNAGWSERALYDAVQVCALFKLMNRFVEGLGIEWPKEPRPALELNDGNEKLQYKRLIDKFDIR